MVRQALRVPVQRVEGVRGERGRDNPPVMRFVDVLVDAGVVFRPVDEVLPPSNRVSTSFTINDREEEGEAHDEEVGEPEEEQRAQDQVRPAASDVPIQFHRLPHHRLRQHGSRQFRDATERKTLDLVDGVIHCAYNPLHQLPMKVRR